tara:strand:- start:485 stop:679 length:195 start_codon:yes stop_codon:yes gene_type:complete
MAVQKSKKSRSKRGMRRAHQHIESAALSEDKMTGEVHRRHHVTKHGYYKGKQVIILKEKKEEAS